MQRLTIGLIALLVLLVTPHALAQKGGKRPAASQPAEKPQKAATPEPKGERVRVTFTDPAAWVPADALVYVGITDVADTWQDLQKTSNYAALSDTAALGAIPGANLPGTLITELKDRLARTLDVPPDQLQNPFAGPLACFVTAPFGAKPEELEPGLVAGVGDAALMKKYYDAAIAKLNNLGKHDTVTAGSDTIDVFTIEPARGKAESKSQDDEFDRLDAGAGPGGGAPDELLKKTLGRVFAAESSPRKLALCLTAERVIVSGSADHVQAILRGDASTKTLAESDDYKALLQNLKPMGDIRFLVNLRRIIEMVPAAAEGPQAKELRKQIKSYGLDKLGSLVGHCRLGAASYDWKVDALLLLSGQRTGLAKLLSMDNRPTAPPADIPADTCIYAACNLDVPQWLDELGSKLAGPSDAGAADSAKSWADVQLPGGETVNLRRALLDHLNGPLTASLGLGGAPPIRLLLTIGLRDQNAVTGFLTSSAMQGILQPRELRGLQVFDITPSPLLSLPGLAAATTRERLLAGNTAAVENAIAPTATEPLAQSDAWKRAARYVPAEAWFTLYIDNRKLLDSLLELAQKPPAPAGDNPAGPDFGTLIAAGMVRSMSGLKQSDQGALDRVRRSATQSIYTIATTPEGVQFTAVQLRPEK
jgi:hypothetical protein